jgi:hypothetical protein
MQQKPLVKNFVPFKSTYLCLGVLLGGYGCSSSHHVGQAAILAIFCTQSNDFGMGIPILRYKYDLIIKIALRQFERNPIILFDK